MITDAILPTLNNMSLRKAMVQLDCPNVEVVDIVPRPMMQVNECHTNVEKQVAMYGGERVQGYYVAISKSTNEWTAIKHSVWKRDNELIDITPVEDNRSCNVFVYGADKLHTSIYSSNNKLLIDNTITYKKDLHCEDNSME
tara:strand:+ start:4266 stop:4688 length:423 start_codon:yes stop_codon:yes gene_type:complete